eukprot:GFUD01116545.1.p2 GENE.GFUD01116545.1~~GFUD01116545.1.p2  ORF type:complete len:161 (+),score=29.44 GFUD01116545.1:68-550(+)
MLKVLNIVTTSVPTMVDAQSDILVQAGQEDYLDPAFHRALVAAVVVLLRNAKIATELNIVLNKEPKGSTLPAQILVKPGETALQNVHRMLAVSVRMASVRYPLAAAPMEHSSARHAPVVVRMAVRTRELASGYMGNAFVPKKEKKWEFAVDIKQCLVNMQ